MYKNTTTFYPTNRCVLKQVSTCNSSWPQKYKQQTHECCAPNGPFQRDCRQFFLCDCKHLLFAKELPKRLFIICVSRGLVSEGGLAFRGLFDRRRLRLSQLFHSRLGNLCVGDCLNSRLDILFRKGG